MLAHSIRVANLVRKAANPNEDKLDEKYDISKVKQKHIMEDPEVILKREVREAVGKIDPKIKHGVEKALNTVTYKRKTKIDLLDDVVGELDKKLEALRSERITLEKVFSA